MMKSLNIQNLIPQRPPFLFIDKIVDYTHPILVTSLRLTGEEAFFQGHFPGRPIMPGVLLQEAAFQSGAAFMALKDAHESPRLGVVARISSAKFKNIVTPPADLIIATTFKEQLAEAAYFSSTIKVEGKLVLAIEYTVYAL